MKMYPKYIKLPKFDDHRGNLSFFEHYNHIPFKIVSTFLVSDIKSIIFSNLFKIQYHDKFIVPLSGSFDLTFFRGKFCKLFHLDKPNLGLFIPGGFNYEFSNFSDNCIFLIVCSESMENENNL